MNVDTDGDGFIDGDEVEFNSDPTDPDSVPVGGENGPGEAIGSALSVLNTVVPSATEASGSPVAVLNETDPSASEASSPTLSVLNETDPSADEASGPPVSVFNQAGATAGASKKPTGDAPAARPKENRQ